MPFYPATIYNPPPNIEGETPLDKVYLDTRDDEIRAIERSLGLNLVHWAGSGPDVALSDRVRTTSLNDGGNLVLAENAGSVGIGTALPQTQLHQRKAAGSVTYHEFEVSGVAATYPDAYGDLDFTADRVGSGRSPFGRIRFQRDNAGWNNNNGSMQFWTGNSAAGQGQPATLTERMRIAANGYVGIGTSSPSEPLHVNGNIALGTDLKFGGATQATLSNVGGELRTSGGFDVHGDMRVDDASIRFHWGSTTGPSLSPLDPTTIAISQNLFVQQITASSIAVSGSVMTSGSSLGFYGATPTPKPAVSGSRGGNVALMNLLNQLSSLGLINNMTTE